MTQKGLPRPRTVKSIYQEELERATRIVEQRGRYGKRLRAAHVLYCINEMAPDEWESLSEKTRAWIKMAADYLDRKQDPPPYPDYQEVQRQIRALQARSHVARSMNKRNNRKGASYRARELMLKHGMDISIKEHHQRLLDDGFEITRSSLSMLRTHFKMTVLVLYDNGQLVMEPRGFESAYKEKYED